MRVHRSVGSILRASVATRPRDDVADLIAEAIRSHGPGPGALDGLAEFASLHGVPGYVYRAVREVEELPPSVEAALAAHRSRALRLHLLVRRELAFLKELFGAAGVPWLVMKGPVLAEVYHESVELRSYGDLDVLVPPDRLGDALAALESDGCSVQVHNWWFRQDQGAQIPIVLPSGIALDLHWHLLANPEVRPFFNIDIPGLFARSRTLKVGDLDVRTLSAEDTIVFIAMHSVLSGAHRLIWLKDIERTVAVDETSLVRAHERARHWRAELALGSALTRAALTIDGFRAPAELRPRGLGDRIWLAGCRRVWERVPAEWEVELSSAGRLVSDSVRHDAASSARALTRSLRSKVTGLGPRGDDFGELPGHYRTDSGSYEGPGGAGRHAFVERVAQQAEAATVLPAAPVEPPGDPTRGARRATPPRGQTSGEDEIRVPHDVLVQRLAADEWFFLNAATDEFIGLQGSAGAMWAALTETGSIGAALTRLDAEFDIDVDVLRQDLRTLLDHLTTRGLLEVGRAGD